MKHKRNRRAHVYTILGAFIAACISGCNTNPPAARADPLMSDEYPQITAEDNLEKWIGFSSAVVEDGPPLHVSVPVRSLTQTETLNIQYRFLFFDDRGRDVSTSQDWRFLTLSPRVREFITATAIDDRAKDWNLRVRPAR